MTASLGHDFQSLNASCVTNNSEPCVFDTTVVCRSSATPLFVPGPLLWTPDNRVLRHHLRSQIASVTLKNLARKSVRTCWLNIKMCLSLLGSRIVVSQHRLVSWPSVAGRWVVQTPDGGTYEEGLDTRRQTV